MVHFSNATRVPFQVLATWLDASELGGLVEKCRITFHDDRGQELYFDVERDYRKENLSMTLTGKHPENLKEHHGINIVMAEMLLKGLKVH